ncbi:uncharacterized protein G2W53_006315 [Senna tora]|uniref:Uncharacterized protein n=1 Tax=Senna tora TaxID=362788 RepID=A0A834X3F3_9FABA|nr:uncharacterized protein G2W53_006315 [Senna tora]
MGEIVRRTTEKKSDSYSNSMNKAKALKI